MNIGIFDSSKQCRSRLNDIVTAALMMKDFEVNVSEYPKSTDLLKDIADDKPFGFVIYSCENSSDESTLKLIEKNTVCIRVLKPFTVKDVVMSIKPVVSDNLNRKYLITTNRKIEVINVSDILYIESDNNRCIFHCTGGKQLVQYKQLDLIEKELCYPNFLRSHKSYLVNMDYIVSADKSFILSNGDEVMIRQREIAAIKQRLVEYQKRNVALAQ